MSTTHHTPLHNKAMEFAEKARFAYKKGERETAKLLYQKAFEFEKRYVFSFPNHPKYSLSRVVFIRSAAYLALNSGNWKEAHNFAKLGLAETPRPDFITEFEGILKESQIL